MWPWRGQWFNPGYVTQKPSTLLFEIGFPSGTWGSPIQPGRLAQEPQVFAFLHLSLLEWQVWLPCLSLHVGVGNWSEVLMLAPWVLCWICASPGVCLYFLLHRVLLVIYLFFLIIWGRLSFTISFCLLDLTVVESFLLSFSVINVLGMFNCSTF